MFMKTRYGRPTKWIPEYQAWRNAKSRCFNEKHPEFHNYGARGITMCAEWVNDFGAFFAHIGARPGPRYTLERIDNHGDYAPGNVRWATKTEQGRNTRRNNLLTINGETRTIAEWVERSGLHTRTVRARLRKGWPAKSAVFTPLLHPNYSHSASQH